MSVEEVPETYFTSPIFRKDAGVKHDFSKPPMHLIPPELLTAVSSVLDFGAKKYEARNWEKGLEYSRVFSALQRHMWSWWAGKDNDEETGMSHLWHAACCIAFLVAFEARGTGADDRPASHSHLDTASKSGFDNGNT